MTIPLLGRYLEAADTYHALLEGRPHPAAWSRKDAAAELRRAAHAGELDGTAVDAVLVAAGHATKRKPAAPVGLTPREIEVLVLASREGTIRGEAQLLDIAPKTVGTISSASTPRSGSQAARKPQYLQCSTAFCPIGRRCNREMARLRAPYFPSRLPVTLSVASSPQGAQSSVRTGSSPTTQAS